ncbi:MAG: InlB B-repeat-containing protein [Faecousia sp.]
MKKKVAALLLCVAMVLTLVPALPVRAEGGNALSVYCGGSPVSQLTLPQSEKKELTAVSQESGSARYQWQILANQTLWVDIAGANGSTLDLSYAMVASLLSDDSVQIRATATSAGETVTSEPVTVTVTYPAPQPENVTPAQTSVTAAALQTSDSTVAPLADGETKTYNVVIKYVFENNEIAADPYTASLAAGSSFNTTVTFPTVQGYLPYVGNDTETSASIDLNITNIQNDVTYTVTYKPTNVDYTVIHYQQNLNDDNYTEAERETKQGLTKSTVPDVANTYDGFYALLYEKPEIAADGSTLVEVYYDRYYYLMNFDLDGGYGVEPIYARYGTPIADVGTPTKAGYSFQGWSLDGINIVSLPEKMPAENRTYKAIWGNAKTVDYTVVYWKENANDSNYSFWGQVTRQAVAGTTVSGQDDIPASITTTTVDGGSVNEKPYFTFNAAKTNKNVLVNGDGTTVVNVYYYRNTYHLYFRGISGKCAIEEHTHTASCYHPCTKLEHTHTNNCSQNSNNNVIYVISAKYEQNIADVWPTADKFSNYTLNGWSIDGISSMAVSKRVSMTADLCDTSDNLKYAVANSGGSKQYLYYMFESFDQTSAANGDQRKKLNRTYYDSDARYYQQVNSGANNWGQKPIEGMTPVKNGVKYESKNTKVFLYYTRNRSDLMFNNSSDGVVKTASSIMYEQPLANYKDTDGNLISSFVPSYPSKLEPNAFEFAGWYTTPECYPGTEYDFATATMPNGDLTLYAYWKPLTHKVEFYLDKDALDAGIKLSTHPDITVPHGSKVDPVPAEPTNGSYNFVGWFYMDGGVEKAFDFANMPVNKNMQVYGKWSSNVLKQYFIYFKYKDADGNEVEIADRLTGSALAGVTETFEAKGGDDLYPDFQEGYFPVTKSHSLTIDINATEDNNTNVYTFWYVQKAAVPYTVKYLNKETGEPVADEKTVADNRKAVVTETFVPVSGMLPDAYQKRLVVSAEDGAVNEIIFYYTEDTTHAYYKITHYTQNIDGATWTEYASSHAVGDIGTTYTADPMTIPGFTYDPRVEGTLISDKLTANGLELKLYYTRNAYPYQVRYLEKDTGKQLDDPKSGTGLYGQVISESAIAITNYTAVAPISQTLNIRIEESQTEAKLNIITFYYTENEATINYVVVGPAGCGTVSPTSETLKVLSGTAQGSTPTANENFRFIGWYTDAACTTPVTTGWVDSNNKLTPVKGEGGVWTNATYYAKFEYDLADLTIVKTGAEEIDENQSFIFHVDGVQDTRTENIHLTVVINGNGSKTIKGLLVGDYTVTEDGNWSWRYTASGGGQITLSATEENEVTFYNTRASAPTTDKPNGSVVWKWLNGDAYCINKFNAILNPNP